MAVAMESRSFIKYIPPPSHPVNCKSPPDDLSDEILEWKERMKYIHDDIDWLLRLPAKKFWEQITKDASFAQSYDFFWQFCPRPHDLQPVHDQCIPIQNQMKKLMLLLFIRISDDREMDGFSGSPHAKMIYDNFLIDIPKIIDVCSIYAFANDATKLLISESLNKVFEKQEAYWHDLEIAVETILKTFDSVSDKFAFLQDEDETTPKQLSDDPSANFSHAEFEDVIVYLYDTFSSLVSLVSFCAYTSPVLLQKDVLMRAAVMVDKYIPRFKANSPSPLNDKQKTLFMRTKKLCLQFCNLVIKECFFKGKESVLNDSRLCHEYLEVVNLLLSHSKFIVSYEKRYGFSQELSIVEEGAQNELGDTIQYIRQVLSSLMPENATGNMQPVKLEEAGAAASMENDAIELVVVQVKSMLPDESDPFLRACVVHFDGDAEKVINHLLEENIPPFLQDIREPKNTSPKGPLGRDFIERDIGNQLSGHFYMKSEVGRKEIENEIFNDRSVKSDHLLRIDHDYYDHELSGFDEYDDEYDDTYDSQNVGILDADSCEELKDLTARRSFVTPKVLAALEKHEHSSGNEEDEEEGSQEDEEKEKANADWNGGQPSRPRPYAGRGRGQQRNDGRGRGNRGGQKSKGDKNAESVRGRGDGRPTRGRGRGGHSGKKHNQKSLAFRKSARSMAGI